MAAFGTVKPGFEKAAELQFPQQFSREYARRQLGLRYAPSDAAPVVQDYVGDDFFADYHAQKRADSQRSVLTGVADTRRSVNRAMVSHAGVYGMPEPVRSQRKIGSDVGVHIGANALYGAGLSNAASVAGLEGGVIGSREGRDWTKNALQKRIAEFDAIDAAQAEGPTVQAAVEKGIEPGQVQETEAAVVWQRLLQEARGGNLNQDVLALLPRAASSLAEMFSVPENLDKLDDYQYEIDDAATALRASLVAWTRDNENEPYIVDPRDRVSDRLGDVRQMEAIFNTEVIVLDFFRSALKYLALIGKSTQEVGVPSEKQMKSISRAAAKESKLGVGIKIRSLPGKDMDTQTRRGSRPQDLISSYPSGSSGFTPDGTSYEDSSGPSTVLSRGELNDFNQDIFGRQGQKGEFRGERNYFGEDTDQSSWRPGVDVIEEAPRGFTNVVRGLSTDVDYKEAEDDDSEEAKTARMRSMAEELGITTLDDIEEAVDEMSPEEGRLMLNRIINRLQAAYTGQEKERPNRSIAEAKKGLRAILRKAYA
jgi:hypothetical protein